MPTENRSSNSEMVSFPRELSDDLAELIAARARVCGGGAFEIWEEICNGFGKPADQHQGEPVAYADPRSFENLKSFGRLGGIYLHEWMWAEPEPGMVPLYTRPAQGEPVGWQFYQDRKWWNGDDRIKDHRKNTEDAGYPVRDVFAQADPGEVERLREDLASAVADKEAYAQNAIDLRRRVENADLALKVQTQNCDALRAQLAALLAAVSKHREALKPLGLPLGDSLEEAALSASVEPGDEFKIISMGSNDLIDGQQVIRHPDGTVVVRDQYGETTWPPSTRSELPLADPRDADLKIAIVGDSISEGRELLGKGFGRIIEQQVLADIERDERAAFEKEFPVPGGVRFLEADNCYVDERFDYEGGGSYQPAWEAWQARAALGRKQ